MPARPRSPLWYVRDVYYGDGGYLILSQKAEGFWPLYNRP